jgi:TolA-binding protein
MYKKETKETLDSIKDYSNYNLNQFDISNSNSKSKIRKVSISSMDEQISKLDSDISELYKIYRETKKTRIEKEKNEKNLINRINYLTSEEKKLRAQMMNKNDLKRRYYQTTYNSYKNSPKIRNKRINSVDNYTTINTKGDSSNLNDSRKYKIKQLLMIRMMISKN